MLAGEYAVLDGAPSVVAAVDRHAIARVVEGEAQPLPPEAALTLEAARDDHLLATKSTIAIDVRALQHEGTKLGLGSSAAASVAALAAALSFEGRVVDRDTIARIARSAHRRAQGGGSGVDVLASAYGGVLGVTLAPDASPAVEHLAWPNALHLAVFWTGAPARTSDLLAKVRAARGTPEVERALEDITSASTTFLDALRTGQSSNAIRAISAHHVAMRNLGRASGANIVTDTMEQLASLAEPLGVAVKPSGAGGGDIVIALTHDPSALDTLAGRTQSLGVRRLGIGIDPDGVRVEGGSA
jgi:phosphomevalonate kinase